MKAILSGILCFLVSAMLCSQTTVPSGNVSGVWSKSASPYLIQGEITVAKGSVLTLEPGTVLEFQGNFGMTVKGVLNSIGKKGDSIVYKAGAGLVWAGISYVRNIEVDTIEFNYCRFENVGEGSSRNGYVNYAIQSMYTKTIKIKNCAFYFLINNVLQGGSIYCRKNNVILDSLYFQSSANEIRSYRGNLSIDSSEGFIVSNLLFNTNKKIISLSGDLIILACNKGVRKISNVSNMENSSFGLSISGSSFVEASNFNLQDKCYFTLSGTKNKITNFTFKNSLTTAIRTFGNCTGTIIENSLVENCGDFNSNPLIPSLNLSSAGPLFYNCKFLNNPHQILINQKNGSGSPFFLSCMFDGNKSGAAAMEGYPVFMNCNFTNNNGRYFKYSILPPYYSCIAVGREFDNSRPYFYNCLLWGNRDSFGNSNSVVLIDKVVKADFNHCVIQGDSSKGIVGMDGDDKTKFQLTSNQLTYLNSSGTSPSFVDSSTGNYQLINNCNQQSQIINKGMRGNLLSQYPYNTLLSVYGINIYQTKDLAGNPRVVDDTLDVGCYESQGNKKTLSLQQTVNDTQVCYGANLNYAIKHKGFVENFEWQTQDGSNIQTVSNAANLSLNDLRTTDKHYRLLVSNTECLPLKDSSAWFKISVAAPIKKGISQNKDTIEQKDTVELSTVSQNYSSIKWSNGAITPTLKIKGSSLNTLGIHAISVEARKNTGCVETDTVYIYVNANSNIVSNQVKQGIKIYPTPSQTQLTIEGEGVEQIAIYSLDGKSIQTILPKSTQETINISELPRGMYVIKVKLSTGEIQSLRMVKE